MSSKAANGTVLQSVKNISNDTLKKPEASGVDALMGHTRTHPEHDG